MDWNGDGKHDYQDHSFYNNVIEPNEKRESHGGSSKNKNSSTYDSNSSSTGAVWLVVISVIYLLIKLIGG